jgi:hypothetical protein
MFKAGPYLVGNPGRNGFSDKSSRVPWAAHGTIQDAALVVQDEVERAMPSHAKGIQRSKGR